MSTRRIPRSAFPRLVLARVAAVLLPGLLSSAPTPAQCASQWLASGGVPGVDGSVYVTRMWDRDGAGPLPPVLVVGGSFNFVGNTPANSIATYDPATGVWSPLGGGLAGQVLALTTLPNGELLAGGQPYAGGGFVARWDGTSWSFLGSNWSWAVRALAAPGGTIVAGGVFVSVGSLYCPGIVQWNGSSWSPLGAGGALGPGGWSGGVEALEVLANGQLVAGGGFSQIGGVAANGIARWNGTTWVALGSGAGANGWVGSLKTLTNGDLVAGGGFASGIGVHRWNGTSWATLGSLGGPYASCRSITQLPNGDLVVVGGFTSAGGVAANLVARWNGTTWSPLGSGLTHYPYADAVTSLGNGDVAVGGLFQLAGGVVASSIARWNGTTWSAMAAGTAANGQVSAMVVRPNGDVIAAGDFQILGGIHADRLARWNGSAWTNIGHMGGVVLDLAACPNGDVIASGHDLNFAGGVAVNKIARWSNGVWSPMHSGPYGYASLIDALAACPNGDVIAAGSFWQLGGVGAENVARWNGAGWSPLGSGVNNRVFAATTLANGDVVVGGQFSAAGGVPAQRIARWDGVAWSPLGSGMDGTVEALLVMPNGDLVAGGQFTTAGGLSANRVARWDGTVWSAFGTGLNGNVVALARLPDGDLVAAGGINTAGGVPASRIARWNGTTWSTFGSGMLPGSYAYVHALAATANALFVGGSFQTADGVFSPNLARYATNCPATVTPAGLGCTGSGGASTFSALNAPWVGATFRARGTNLPASAFAVVVTGFATTNLSLGSLVPPSPAPCALLVTPNLLDVALVAGSVETQLAIPDVPSLAGLPLHQQLVALEVDAALQLLQSTSTNALSLTVGAL